MNELAITINPIPLEENMERTVTIDLQKLQLLNDRICQTIDALNQVRMSVRGQFLPHQAQPVHGLNTVNTWGQPVYGQIPTAAYGQSFGLPVNAGLNAASGFYGYAPTAFGPAAYAPVSYGPANQGFYGRSQYVANGQIPTLEDSRFQAGIGYNTVAAPICW